MVVVWLDFEMKVKMAKFEFFPQLKLVQGRMLWKQHAM